MNRLGWADIIPIRVENVILGVRASSRQLAVDLRTALGERVVDVEGVPAHYSVRINESEPSTSGRRELHQLFEGNCLEMRSTDGGAIIRALIELIEVHRRTGGREIRVRATALLDSDDRAVLLPTFARREVVRVERRLNSKGLRLLRPSVVRMDLRQGQLLVGRPVVEVGATTLSRKSVSASEVVPRVKSGRYPVHRWYVYQRGCGVPGAPLSTAVAVGGAMESVVDIGSELTRRDVWRLLVDLMPRIDVACAGDGDVPELLRNASLTG